MCTTKRTLPEPEQTPPEPANSSPSDTASVSPSQPSGSRQISQPELSTSPTPSTPTETSSCTPNEPADQNTESQLVPLAMIHIPDDKNGRAELNMTHAQELAEQISKDGLLHPITLRPRGDGFELIAGRHRLEAFRLLAWPHAPAIVKHVTDYQAGMLRMSENVSRSQLSPAEEAFQLAALLNETPGGVDELAGRTGRSVNWILDRLEMCDWPDDLMQAIHHGKISLAAAKHLAKIPDPETRALRVRDAALNGISARTASLWLQNALADVQADFVPPENCSQLTNSEYETTTFCNCVCCKRKTELERTRYVRICTDCLGDLEAASTERAAQETNSETSQPQETSGQTRPLQ